MIVYYINNPNGQNYQIINYYVDGAIPLTAGDKIADYIRQNWPWLTGVGVGVVAVTIGSIVVAVIIKRKKVVAT